MTDTGAGREARERAGRAGGFLAGGAVGGALAWLVLAWLPGLGSPLVPLVTGTAVATAAVGLALWALVVRPPRTGPSWGGLVAAWIPAVVTTGLAVFAVGVADLTARGAVTASAVLYLVSMPLTAVLAVVGALLERLYPSGEAPGRR